MPIATNLISIFLAQAVEILAALKRLGEDLSAEEQVFRAFFLIHCDGFDSIVLHSQMTLSFSTFLNPMHPRRLPLSPLLKMQWMKSQSRCTSPTSPSNIFPCFNLFVMRQAAAAAQVRDASKP